MSEAAEIAHDFDAIAAGEHDIENQKVERFGLREKESVLTRGRDTDRVLVGFESLFYCYSELGFVFHNEDAHETNVKLFRLTFSSLGRQE